MAAFMNEPSSRRAELTSSLLAEDRVDFCSGIGLAQPGLRGGIAQLACRGRKHAQLAPFVAGGKQQQKDEIDGLLIDCLEFDRFAGAREDADRPRDLWHPCMRNGNARAGSRGAELLALK